MKKLFSILFFLALAAHLSAQQGRPSLFVLMQETNRMMDIYSCFKPGGVTFHCFREMELKPYEISRIQTDGYWGRYLSHEKDSIAVFAAIELFQERISDNLHKIISHPDFSKRMNKRQTLSDLKGINAVVSEDDARLYNFTFDSKSGSAYQSQISVMHYLRPAQSVSGFTSWSSNNTRMEKIDPKAYRIFSTDGYTEIYLLDKGKAVYLLIGQAITGNNSFECYADLVSFKDNTFVKNFEHRIITNKPDNCVVFDKKNNILKMRESTFAFDGTTFVKK
ncbi:MAG: hypothetical protein LBR75_02250 [Prevotellaceae bacterium]|jgi:hypothetical protein|nr:hypothetical protein [Prevotellaceae bacterium]